MSDQTAFLIYSAICSVIGFAAGIVFTVAMFHWGFFL